MIPSDPPQAHKQHKKSFGIWHVTVIMLSLLIVATFAFGVLLVLRDIYQAKGLEVAVPISQQTSAFTAPAAAKSETSPATSFSTPSPTTDFTPTPNPTNTSTPVPTGTAKPSATLTPTPEPAVIAAENIQKLKLVDSFAAIGDGIYGMKWSSDNRLLLLETYCSINPSTGLSDTGCTFAGRNSLLAYETATWNKVGEIPIDTWMGSSSISGNGRKMYWFDALNAYSSLYLVDIIANKKTALNASWTPLALNNDGSIAAGEELSSDNGLFLTNPNGDNTIIGLETEKGFVANLSGPAMFSLDGSQYAQVGVIPDNSGDLQQNSVIMIWDTQSGKLRAKIVASGTVGHLLFVASGMRIAGLVYPDDGQVNVTLWEADTGRKVVSIPTFHAENNNFENGYLMEYPDEFAISPDGSVIAFPIVQVVQNRSTTAIAFWSVQTNNAIMTIPVDRIVEQLAFSLDGRWLAYGTSSSNADIGSVVNLLAASP